MMNYAWDFSQYETEKFFEWIIKKFIRWIVLLTLWTTGGQSRTPVHHHAPTPLPPPINGEYHSAKVMSFLSNGEYTEAVSIFPQGASLWQSFSNISPLQLVLVPKVTSWWSRNALGQDKRPFKVVISFDCLVPLRFGLVPREWLDIA